MEKQCECQCGCDEIILVTIKQREGNAPLTTRKFMLSDVTDYARCTDYLFSDSNITFERLNAWNRLSNRFYSILPYSERYKMRTLFKSRWTYLYNKVTLPLKIVLIMWYSSWVLFK